MELSAFRALIILVGAFSAYVATELALRWEQRTDASVSEGEATAVIKPAQAQILKALICAGIVASAIRAPDGETSLASVLLLSGLAYLAVIDLRTMLVPILPCMCLALAGLVFHGLLGGADAAIAQALIATIAALAFVVLAFGYRLVRGRVGLGSGDAMIAGAIGAWLDPAAIAWSVAIGGVASLLFVARGWASDRALPLAPGLATGVVGALLLGGAL